ncbi:MAG: HD domain-containing protein [Patescibacteria group bacterium]|nr:HD domain-containing protein [Patescibacteria group bacterium]
MSFRTSKTTIKKDIGFLYEIGTLRNIRRSWNQLTSARFQNLTEHIYRTAWISLILAKRMKQKIDLERVLILSFSYSLYKTRCGDFHYTAHENVGQEKELAFKDLLAGTSLDDDIQLLVQDYQIRKSIEAKIVYTANGLEIRLELAEHASDGIEVAGIWGKLNDQLFIDKVLLPIGKRYWKKVAVSKPYNWHLASKNRFNFKKRGILPSKGISADIDFFYELGSLKQTERTWVQFVGDKFSNLVEHIFRVVWFAIILSNYEKKVNSVELIEMAMLHDLAEIRSGDANYITMEYLKRNKQSAMKETLSNLDAKKDLLDTWEKFEKQRSLVSQIVRDADCLEAILELKEQESMGMSVAKKWLVLNKKRLLKSLRTDTAKVFLREILISDPHAWHLSARNRFRDRKW